MTGRRTPWPKHLDDDICSVWVRTQPSASGRTYVVTVEYSPDHAVTLKPLEAQLYAQYVLAAAMRADHDAAVFSQLIEKVSLEHTAETLRALRDDRPALRRPPAVPLTLDPGVNIEGESFLHLTLGDSGPQAQWTVQAAREHAHAVLEAVTAADLDAAYYRYLIGVVGLDEPRARAAVGDLLGRVST